MRDETDEQREDREFDAGDLSTSNEAEEQAASDFEEGIGTEEHEAEVDSAREEAGLEQHSSEVEED